MAHLKEKKKTFQAWGHINPIFSARLHLNLHISTIDHGSLGARVLVIVQRSSSIA